MPTVHSVKESVESKARSALENFISDHLPIETRLKNAEVLGEILERENEEIAIATIKLIIEFHKSNRPQFIPDVITFLGFIRQVYRNLKTHICNIFKTEDVYEVNSLVDLRTTAFNSDAFSVITVKTKESGPNKTYHLIPKSSLSLKVMSEIPILIVLFYQLYRPQILDSLVEVMPLIMDFINMRPLSEHMRSQSCKESRYLDFMAAQVKTLSFLAYIVKYHQVNTLNTTEPLHPCIESHYMAIVKGIMNLMITCPSTATNLRKEFFIATRHILNFPDIRPKFLHVIDDMMDDSVLVGEGFYFRESLRPLSYSMLGDLLHHIRNDLSLTRVSRAVDLFGKNLFDETLPFSIQMMCQRVILNLADCMRIRVMEKDPSKTPPNFPSVRRLFFQILYICVQKCRIFAECYIPELEAKCIREDGDISPEHKSGEDEFDFENGSKRTNSPFIETFSPNQMSVNEMKSTIKVLVSGIRSVVVTLTHCPHTSDASFRSDEDASAANPLIPSHLTPDEVQVLSDYLVCGLRLLDIFRIVSKDGVLYLRGINSGVKYPEERSVLENLANTFVPLSATSFKEIFAPMIGFIVDWCRKSPLFYAHFAYHILSQTVQTSTFGRILLSYLVERLDKIGEGNDLSFTYMRLLKFCFNSVNLPNCDNEQVMKMHLRKIVQGSMQCCLEAREPIAYLSLLRALFRSIGGGAHDRLYKEFFPLLPEMLTTLNRLLRSAHRTHARDLLGELCVIVPVRLSTLLPYLSLLMEPLTYVINCNTVNQGLRTLELCVDNMQPDFLYQHLYQVRGDMLLGLYTSLHSQSEYVQKMAFKVLGKLGRFNRADISDVQRLNLSVSCGESGPLLRFWLHEFPHQPVDLPIRSLVDFSVEVIQEPTVDHLNRIRAWQFLRGVCISSLNVHTPSRNPNGYLAYEFMNHLSPYPLGILREVIMKLDSHVSFHDDKPSIYHLVAVRVIGGIFLSTSVTPEIPDSGAFMTFLIRHLTLLGLLEERKATQPVIPAPPNSTTSDVRIPLDSRVLIEAVCFIMGYEDKELVRTGYIIMDEILSTASTAIEAALCQDGSIQESASDILPRLPMMQYFAKAITDMLYHPAWYVKWGGCYTLLYLRDRISVSWFREHLVTFLRGLLHCLHDLTNQMGQGALSLAQNCLKSLIEFVFSKEAPRYTQRSSPKSGVIKEEEPSSLQHSSKRSAVTRRKSFATANKRGGTSKRKSVMRDKDVDSPIYDYMEDKDIPEVTPIHSGSLPLDIISQTPLINAVLNELVESLLSETKIVRTQVRNLLSVIAECLSIPLGTLLKPHIHRIDGWLPPKNRNHRLSCLPISTQIAVLETNYFLCQEMPHGAGLLHYSPTNRRCDNRFLADIRAIMEAPLPNSADISSQSTSVRGLPPPQNILSSLQLQMAVNLKLVAAQVLSTMHYLDAQKATILGALFKGICSEDATIHKSVFESTKVFVEHSAIDMELRNTLVRPILPNFRQTSNIRLASIRQLAYCAELFPTTFSERFCETIDNILVNFVNKSSSEALPQNLELLSALMELFPLIPLAKEKYVHSLLSMVIKVEKQLSIEKTSPLRLPLVRFLLRYPKKAFEVVLNGFSRPDDTHAQRIILHLVTLPEGKPLLTYLIENISILIDFIRPQDTEPALVYETTSFFLPKFNGPLAKASTFHLGLRLVHILFNQCREWFLSIIPSGDQSILSCSADEYPLLRVLLDIWNSAFFWRRHSYFTVVKLQELQPHVALSLLLEDTGDEGKRIIPSTSAASMTSASQSETMENLTMSRVRIYEGITNLSHVVEPFALLEILMTCAERRRNDFDLLFAIVAGMSRHHCVGQNPLSRFIQRLAKEASVAWCREIFLYFVALMKKRIEASDISAAKTASRKKHQVPSDSTPNRQGITTSVSEYLETSEAHAKLLANFITPCLFQALQTDPAGLIALGKPPKPDEPNSDDLVHILVDLMSTDQDAKKSTGLRIMYYQIASLFVYYAPAYVQDASSKVKSYRFKEITDQVQHCITSSMSVVDLQEKYMGLQVIANTIFHFFPLMGHWSGDVFQALTKGPQTEVRKMVIPAIDVLLPVWVTGPNEQKELALILKKAMQEDQSVQSVAHFLGIVLRHSNLFYPVRHILINALIITINRLSTQVLPIDQRRMILSIIEVVMKWDMRCHSEKKQYLEQQQKNKDPANSSVPEREFALMEKPIRDQMCNFLVRYACQCMEPTPNGPTTESSAKKAISLIETIMASDIWGGPTCDLRLSFIDRNLSYEESPSIQVNSQQQQPVQVVLPSVIFMTIEVLRTVYSTLDSPTLFANIKHFNRALLNLLSRYPINFRLVRASSGLIKALLTKYPPEPAHRQKITNYPELCDLYEYVIKFIHEAITTYTDSTSRTPGLVPRLQSAFCLLTTTQQVPINPYAFVDRCLSPLVKLFHRLVLDVVGQTSGNSAQDSTTLSRKSFRRTNC
nr:transformation:transcription domain associated [Hymenolepis microstoma]